MRILRPGSFGPAVELLQLALSRAGLGPLTSDGLFGSGTDAALRGFQRQRGLRPDGIAGAETHRALLPFYTGFLVHRLRPGESLSAVADLYGSSLPAIETATSTAITRLFLAGGMIPARNMP